jgi:hypothetical protein
MSGILGGFTGGGFGATSPSIGIEDVFSTYLYTGTGGNLTITNGINLSTNGGLTWIKQRSGSQDHSLFDTTRGTNNYIRTNSISVQSGIGSYSDLLTAFNTTGFSLGADASTAGLVNASGSTYVSWAFREQPKFFDIVTYTGNGSSQTISHNLGSIPGCIIVKGTTTTSNWPVYHSGIGASQNIRLTTTGGAFADTATWNAYTPTATNFQVGASSESNQNGQTYIAYLFASNAGGFGLTGADNVITCGSYTGNGSTSGPVVTLGYEPQWLLIKNASTSGNNWVMVDNMRGFDATNSINQLFPNLPSAEFSGSGASLNSTGFSISTTGTVLNGSGNTYIYIAIRRGPMKVPTDATKVFVPVAYSGNGAANRVLNTGNVLPDLAINMWRTTGSYPFWMDRLRGQNFTLRTSDDTAEVNLGAVMTYFDVMNNLKLGYSGYENAIGTNYVYEVFQRAPGFFDVVTYTGDGLLSRDIPHSLKVTPEIIFAKRRDSSQNWIVNWGTTLATNINLFLNTTDANVQSSFGVVVRFSTASTFSVAAGPTYDANISGATYIAYLFASCPGVSKVGLYTGTGATQTINCGFTGGARFVMIKRTDSTGDWYVWDTARGMVSGTDPSLLLNSTAAEVNTNSVYTTGVGFQIVSTVAGINASGGTYIFLAIA